MSHSAEIDVAALIADVEENGCDHQPRVGGWCLVCEEWLARLRPIARVTPPEQGQS